LADLAFNGLHSYLKEKLEGFDFITVNHLQMRAIGVEFKYKNSKILLSLIGPTRMLLKKIRIVRTMRKRVCMPPSMFGLQRTNPLHVLCFSRFKRIGRMR